MQVHEQLCALEAKCAEAKRVQKIDDSLPMRRAAFCFRFARPHTDNQSIWRSSALTAEGL